MAGRVAENMKLALQKTYDAVPSPKIVVAVGACAISGGPYIGHAEACGGADAVVPVDLYVPGCPPHPYTILDGLLRLLGRIEGGAGARGWTERMRAAALEVGEASVRENAQAGVRRADEAARYLDVAGDADESKHRVVSEDAPPTQ